VTRAEQPVPTVGFLHRASPGDAMTPSLAGFHAGLKEAGYVEGQNVAIVQRWAEGHVDRLPALAADLVQRQAAVIFAAGGHITALAAKAATATVPIVFVNGDDPVKLGLVASMSRPGGNATGVTFLSIDLAPKRLGLLGDLVPGAKTVALLVNPRGGNTDADRAAAAVMALLNTAGQTPVVVHAATEAELEPAFARVVEQRADALLVISDPLFGIWHAHIVALAARHRLPTVYPYREYVAAGGLVSYGASIPDAWRQGGVYVGNVLKGADPATLPVLQPTTFELVVNLKTAKTLGLTVPVNLLANADEVIE
jgi:putative ABC transport system substrate-binding protein